MAAVNVAHRDVTMAIDIQTSSRAGGGRNDEERAIAASSVTTASKEDVKDGSEIEMEDSGNRKEEAKTKISSVKNNKTMMTTGQRSVLMMTALRRI